jgi:hypothetical protein
MRKQKIGKLFRKKRSPDILGIKKLITFVNL